MTDSNEGRTFSAGRSGDLVLPPLSLKVRWGHAKSYKLQSFERSRTVNDVIEWIIDKCSLDRSENYALYSPSMANDRWLKSSDTLMYCGLNAKHTVEIKFPPKIIHIYQWNSSESIESFEFDTQHQTWIASLPVDFRDPLIEYIDWIHVKLKRKKEELCPQYIYRDEEGNNSVRWINMRISLAEQNIPENGSILFVPLSVILKKPITQNTSESTKEGYLIKKSFKATKKTNNKKRWCCVRDNFLFYSPSPSQIVANGFIPLEYYELQVHTKGKPELSLSPMGDSFVSMNNSQLATYVLECEERDLFDWTEAISQRCIIGAGKQVFGVPLTHVMQRKGNNHRIPDIITQTVGFIDIHGLHVEGIFRISASSVKLAKYKSEYNRGVSVKFSDDIDPHIVAGLLKLYLRELPEPIIPFEMYPEFIKIGEQNAKDSIQKLEKLVGKMPEDNYKVLSYLTEFLFRVIQHSEENLMNVQNLAVVFGPNLLRTENTLENSQRLVTDSSIVCKIMESIVLHKDLIFKRITFDSPKPVKRKSANRDAYTSSKKGKRNASTPSLSLLLRKSGSSIPSSSSSSSEERSSTGLSSSGPRSVRSPRSARLQEVSIGPSKSIRMPTSNRKLPQSKAPGFSASQPLTVSEEPETPHTVTVTKAPTVKANMPFTERTPLAKTRARRSGALSICGSFSSFGDISSADASESNSEKESTIQQLLDLLREEREARLLLEARVTALEQSRQH